MQFDLLIKNGLIFTGEGREPFEGSVGVIGDHIAAVGPQVQGTARVLIDAHGQAVAPGFINMISHCTHALMHDGLSESDLLQGVTLEIVGEAISMGPMTEQMARLQVEEQGDIKYDVTWRTLGEFFDVIQRRGISTNLASFVGHTTVRMNVLGESDRAPSDQELEQMQSLVAQAMEDGAVGLSTALIYAPASFSKTDELIALAKVASKYGGIYASHLRSEGQSLIAGVRELLEIAEAADIPSEIYHLKAAGKSNWSKMDEVIAEVEAAQLRGLKITADMYNYTRAHTGLDAAMPTWVQEGGNKEWIARLKQPEIRERVKREMLVESDDWENGYMHAGPEGMLLVGFKKDSLKPLTGLTLQQVAEQRGKHPADVAMDLVIEDDSRIETVYQWMSEENLVKQMKLSWVSFGSDGSSLSPKGVYLKSMTHPRAYGNFARLLGKYVREQNVLTLTEAIRRLTGLPAQNLGLHQRGFLASGYAADIVLFDPDTVDDLATFENPHQLSTGVSTVIVNGIVVVENGKHNGQKSGRVLRKNIKG